MSKRTLLILLFALVPIITCEKNRKFESIPPLQDWVINLRQSTLHEKGTEGAVLGWLVMGAVDTLHVVSQTLYEKQPQLERELLDSLKSNLNELVPELVLVEGNLETEASLLLQIWTDKADGNFVYGFTNLSFSRQVRIEATNHGRSAEVWDDIECFAEQGNPEGRIWWLIKLQATKFAALWVLSNE